MVCQTLFKCTDSGDSDEGDIVMLVTYVGDDVCILLMNFDDSDTFNVIVYVIVPFNSIISQPLMYI